MQVIAYADNEGNIVCAHKNTDKTNLKPIYFDNSPEALAVIRHSCAHLLAQAIKSLYPEAKFYVGPAIENGFYYDFKINSKLGDEDLPKIEERMRELVKAALELRREELSREETLELYKDDELKSFMLHGSLANEKHFSLYHQGDFFDLCAGGHVPSTKFLAHFKLTKIAGAYLGGDEKNEMLTRIYGVAFADKESLKAHLAMLEEAKKRDHKKLGQELGLFTFEEALGGGLPIWLKQGGRVRSKLEHRLYHAHRCRHYEPVRGPEILKADMWRTSGHYENYKENMYFTTIDETQYGLKPMNCVGHVLCYKSGLHSYKDLPIKFFEYGLVHRHEKSGVLNGLFRVREFTQDDAHIFCMPSQIEEQVNEILAFAKKVMNVFGFKWELEISTRPEKSIGEDEVWEIATTALKNALNNLGENYGIDIGGGAFYGPKIDIKITDALGRKWQCGTIQVDFNLPERFDLLYTDANNERKRPVMVHRALLGSFERFIGILLEHTAGELPFFIAPTQVLLLPVKESHEEYAKHVQAELLAMNIDADIDSRNESLAKRIRTGEKSKVPLICVLGDMEVENQSLAVRDRREKQQSSMSIDEFKTFLKGKEVIF